jgi:hypothetical protein
VNASTNAPSRPRQPRPEPELSVELLATPDGQTDGVIFITRGRDTADYLLAPLPSGKVRYFLVQKIVPDGLEPPYLVSLAGEERSCDCQGHRRYGHCKHADALATLIADGRL